jgi:hypothetical protein
MKKNLLFLMALLLYAIASTGQCTYQVQHLEGTMEVNGVQVTVSATGITDSNNGYCPATLPYFIGYNYNLMTSGNGSYTFNFSPPVSMVTLNFGGVSNLNGHYEEVRLYVNGTHYAIPEQGIDNGCDAMAALTAQGNIAGCTDCAVSGWSETSIPGPISSLIVDDTVFLGEPSGSIFSLFICDAVGVSVDENHWANARFSPNPFDNQTELIQSPAITQSTILLYSFDGRLVRQVEQSGERLIVKREGLSSGIYFYRIFAFGQAIKTGKLMVH